MIIEIKIVWKSAPDEKLKKALPEVLTKLEYYNIGSDVTLISINDEKELFQSEYRSFIMMELPSWFNFKHQRLFLLKTNC